KLDPEDNNDPTERLNILNNLSSNGEPYRFLSHLRKAVLCESSAMGRITLQQYIVAKEKSAKPEAEGEEKKEGDSGPDLNMIQAAFRDAGPESASATLALVNEALTNAQGLESFLDSTLGAGQSVNFEALTKLLTEMKNAVEPYTAAEGASAEA